MQDVHNMRLEKEERKIDNFYVRVKINKTIWADFRKIAFIKGKYTQDLAEEAISELISKYS